MATDPKVEIQVKVVGADSAKKELQSVANSANTTSGSIAKGVFAGTAAYNMFAGTIKFVANEMVQLAKVALNQSAQMEQYQIGFQTLTGSAEQANAILADIKKTAAATPFEIPELASVTQLFLSTGMNAEEAKNRLIDLGDAVSATGGGADELQRMAFNLSQIKNLGKASMIDIRQFAYANIPIYDLLAKKMGKTREEVAKMDATEFTFEDVAGALGMANEEGQRFFKGMENQSKTFNGRMSTLRDNFKMLLSDMFDESGGFGSAKGVLERIIGFVDEIRAGWNGLRDAFAKPSPQLQVLLDWLKAVVSNVQAFAGGFQEAWNIIVTELQPAFQNFIGVVAENLGLTVGDTKDWKNTLSELGKIAAYALGWVLKTLLEIAAAITAADTALRKLGSAFAFVKDIGGFVKTVVENAGIINPVLVTSAVSAMGHKANGGIISGSHFSGDRVPIMANSGEMVLNKGQQSNLFKMIGGNKSVNFNAPINIGGNRSQNQGQMMFSNLLMRAI